MEREHISEEINGEEEEKGNNTVEIKVLFFARARDLTGVSKLQLAVSAGSTAHDCLDKLIFKYPSLEEICSCMVLALNEEYTPESAVVKNRDELAIIPPISGGNLDDQESRVKQNMNEVCIDIFTVSYVTF